MMKQAAATEGNIEKGPLPPPVRRWRRLGGLFDLFLRLLALSGTIAALITMATADETLPIFTQLFQFEAKYSDLPAFTYFVITNAIAGGYLVLSLPVSIFNIVKPRFAAIRMFMVFFDTVMVAVVTSGAAAGAAIVYLAQKGNNHANWFAICQQFDSFCQQAGGALIASFAAVVFLMLLVALSAINLYRRRA
ncbi:hypothetical protein SUGI_0708000 [Cryptomeria japonica]|uniref:casparian strip membrane protein 1 n=1 Tax=Cryptomeria japonica TaxID=3369 RepID=UPI002414B2D8|nr:casparian strip membrane protein 1 [Cryptomeria japonica]GLJ35173.1 hypothetical protein SUGI_0708000 [Cryptomeria japonica]